MALCMWLLTERPVFSVHPLCSGCQHFTPFRGQVIFQCVDGQLGGFHFLAITNHAAVNVCAQVFV